MPEQSTHEDSLSLYVVILSGTHVTGKEPLPSPLSKSLNCPWLKGEFAANSANVISRSQAKRGYDLTAVYGRTWIKKMQRIGLMSDGSESDGSGDSDNEDQNKKKLLKKKTGCLALVTHFALRKPARDAIRDVMLEKEVRVIFVILQITKDTLSGRTLGAENPELAEKIMEEKREDLREPEEETDVLVMDSMQDVDALTLNIEEMIRRQVSVT